MCKEPGTAGDARAAMPHPVTGRAADPIALEPADEVIITTLVDNVYDALLTGGSTITRAPFAAGASKAAAAPATSSPLPYLPGDRTGAQHPSTRNPP